MIANIGGIAVGFMVDKVTRIIKINSDMILPAPDLILEGLHNPYIRGICTTDLGMLVVLDFGGILAADEINELKQIDVRQVSGARHT
jgi:chemotaxis signal transduction protein